MRTPATRRDTWIVVAIAFTSSLTGILNGFALDDVSLIQDNARVHGFGAIVDIFTQPYWPPPYRPDLYRPVASLLHAAQYAFGAGSPLVFHVVSDALYVLACVALLRLASHFLPRMAALGVAALFAAHPVHVEAVAEAVNQGDLMVGLVAAIMTIAYLKARATNTAAAPAFETWAMLAAFYMVAALSKESGFVLPGLLVAAEVWLVEDARPARERARSLAPGFAALAVIGAALFALRTAVLSGDVVGAYTADTLAGLSFGGRALTMLSVVPTWARLLFWPAHLQADYSPDEIVASTGWGAAELGGLAIVLAVLAIAVAARRKAPVVTFGIAWFAIMIFPVSNLVVPTSIVVAERVLFAPSMGFVLAVVAGTVAVGGGAATARPRLASVALAATGLLVLLGAARSAARQPVWRNSARLARQTALDAPRSRRVKQAHKDALDALTADYSARIAAAAEKWKVRNEYASLLRYMREDSLATEQLRLSLQEHPDQPELRALLGGSTSGAGGPPP